MAIVAGMQVLHAQCERRLDANGVDCILTQILINNGPCIASDEQSQVRTSWMLVVLLFIVNVISKSNISLFFVYFDPIHIIFLIKINTVLIGLSDTSTLLLNLLCCGTHSPVKLFYRIKVSK
jgi:hypothetical protein